MTHLSTHVLDAVSGRPAAGITVTLTDRGGAVLASAATDDDGRVAALADGLAPGVYRLTFDTGSYFTTTPTFYPEVTITFEVTGGSGKYHVPLLLSPFAYSTYRGS
ncbi:hydroxyisourate hydrolase [Mycolicibacterium cosmeticum]|jgi:5-hydroxyisourate hydrolase|uniref:5-hydroxyisourate hydrolase n=1 Tax=Mycolicibacterium cosmeticum TaxID=258533 RepID=W9B4Y2_MYCCO|nr:hydroxyisourate hydrolase [Mycolicibacterium cosmeticum]TLH81749.1 hydroxyisourate hydrolase [Mycolicibacterium cosmeticum]CDO10072.1 transthyretin [Mycolicibacterium cosmeticum]